MVLAPRDGIGERTSPEVMTSAGGKWAGRFIDDCLLNSIGIDFNGIDFNGIEFNQY
jgi:hypothetical protein